MTSIPLFGFMKLQRLMPFLYYSHLIQRIQWEGKYGKSIHPWYNEVESIFSRLIII